MCSHHLFKSSIHKDISYCSNCGCISYQSIAFITPQSYQRRISLDPILLLASMTLKEANKSKSILKNYNPLYFSARKGGVAYIRLIINLLNFNSSVIYKAILYMDLIYANKETPSLKNIENVACVCVLLAFQFNENCSRIKNIDYLFEFIKTIPYFCQLEIYCLKILNYDLAHLSCYDYLFNIFTMGIISSNIEPNCEAVKQFYESCIDLMDRLVQDDRYLDFSEYEIALGIIKIQLEEKNIRVLNSFCIAYDVDYNEPSLMNCVFVLGIVKKYQNSIRLYDIKTKAKTKSNSKKASSMTNSNTTCQHLTL